MTLASTPAPSLYSSTPSASQVPGWSLLLDLFSYLYDSIAATRLFLFEIDEDRVRLQAQTPIRSIWAEILSFWKREDRSRLYRAILWSIQRYEGSPAALVLRELLQELNPTLEAA
jgi:hypothetical protein